MRFFKLTLTSLLAMTLLGCGSVTVTDYAQRQPALVPEQFFDGKLTAHGVVKNRQGKVTRYFNADIVAYWENGIGTLEEDFVFDDGETQRRVWTLKPTSDNRYTGTAGDVIGEADIEVAGNSMFLQYVLRVPYNDGTIDVAIDDRMYRVSERVVINESVMTKWGVKVGELVLVIRKSDV